MIFPFGQCITLAVFNVQHIFFTCAPLIFPTLSNEEKDSISGLSLFLAQDLILELELDLSEVFFFDKSITE